MIRLLAGLGNPGPEYEGSRHNAGFQWIDAVARTLKVLPVAERSAFGRVARVNLGAGPVWLLQPMTYMNASGKSVAALARFYKIEPAEILVIHDELDLPPGQIRLKLGGSPGGNGVRDVQAQLGSADFWRLRIGIGHPGDRDEVVNYVLRRPPADERDAIARVIEESMAALDLLLQAQMERAMMKLHARPPRPKPPAAAKPPAPPPPTDPKLPEPPA